MDRSVPESKRGQNKVGGSASSPSNAIAGGSFAPICLVLFALLPALFHAFLSVHQYILVNTGFGSEAGEPLAADASGLAEKHSAEDHRLMLLMGIDLLVRAERAIQQELGTYTRALGRVPDLLGSSTLSYRVEISKATANRLVISAVGQGFRSTFDTKAVSGDRLFVTEGFDVKSNFPLPTPPREYLKILAKGVLSRLEREKAERLEQIDVLALEGVYRGFFNYERRPRSSSENQWVWVATGNSVPVLGETIVLDDREIASPPNLFKWVHEYRNSRWLEQEVRGKLELVYLSEQIGRSQTGEYSYEFSDLVAYWNSIAALQSPETPFLFREITKDTALGYRAEIAEKGTGRFWTLNAYGQFTENAEFVGLMRQFDSTRRKIASHGDLRVGGTLHPQNAGNGSLIVADPESEKRLFIDVVTPAR